MARKGIREEDEETEETEETEEGLSEDQDFEETVSRENFSTEEDLDKAVEEAMSSVAAGVYKISEPEQVPDATIVMPDISSLDQENIPDEIQEVPEEIQQEEWDVPLSEETESLEEIAAAEEEKPEEEMEAEAEAQEEEEPEEIPEEIPETLEEERSFNPESVPNAPTIEELLAKAQAAGDTPEVKEDKDNQVTLLDYSDIL